MNGGYHLTPAGGRQAGSDQVDIFSHLFDILSAGNLDVDIGTRSRCFISCLHHSGERKENNKFPGIKNIHGDKQQQTLFFVTRLMKWRLPVCFVLCFFKVFLYICICRNKHSFNCFFQATT
jgi:hypothetical protein